MKRKKPKNKDDEIFRLEEQNRALKKLNRSLLRELKKRNKGRYRSEFDLNDYDEESIPENTKKEKECSQCGKGILSESKVRHLIFEICNICEHRQKVSKDT